MQTVHINWIAWFWRFFQEMAQREVTRGHGYVPGRSVLSDRRWSQSLGTLKREITKHMVLRRDVFIDFHVEQQYILSFWFDCWSILIDSSRYFLDLTMIWGFFSHINSFVHVLLYPWQYPKQWYFETSRPNHQLNHYLDWSLFSSSITIATLSLCMYVFIFIIFEDCLNMSV